MALTDRDQDAEWKRIQKKTFTRWCNEHLKKVENMFVDEITTDFGDGVRLIVLLEVLSQKKLGRYNKKPRITAQRMENAQQALDFLMKKEGIRLVNIGGGDIVNGNLKLILGLIWTLILHYQISMGFDLDDDDKNSVSPKQALLNWLREKLPHKKINNLTTDWNDGTLIAALVDAMAPGLCPDAEEMSPRSGLKNATKAMKLADDWLGIPQLLEPKDMVNPHIDELSMMTYLSQFPNAQLKEGAPIRTKLTPEDLAKVHLAGPGLEYAVKDANNVIDVFTEGAPPADVGVEFKNKDKSAPPVDYQVTQVGDNHYQINYTPHCNAPGAIEAQVTYGGYPVEGKKTIPVVDPSKVKVEGPGVDSSVLVNEEAPFTIDATAAGPGEPTVEVRDADGNLVEAELEKTGPGKWSAKYIPTKVGKHTVDVKYNGAEVEGSPFSVDVCHPGAVKAYGPGLEKAIAGEKACFTVDASEAGDGALGLQIEGPADCDVDCKDTGNNVFEVSYVAPRPGIYSVNLKFSEKDVPGSPFEVRCERPPPDASKCIISGLENPGAFTVDCKDAGGSGLLEVGVCGAYVPVEFVSVKHNGDYTFSVSYDISEPGETTISVKWHDQHLTGSPFTVITN